MAKKIDYKTQVTYNYASSLGAAIRNSLTLDDPDKEDYAKIAGERLIKLLERMQELEQYDDATVTETIMAMLFQAGESNGVADYCKEHKLTNLETAQSVYKRYAKALQNKDFEKASRHAELYNFYLKRAGGPEKNPTEDYLSMGFDDGGLGECQMYFAQKAIK